MRDPIWPQCKQISLPKHLLSQLLLSSRILALILFHLILFHYNKMGFEVFSRFFVAHLSFQKPIRLCLSIKLSLKIFEDKKVSCMVLVILYRRLTSSLLSWQVIGSFIFCLTLQLMSEFLWATVRSCSQESSPFSRSYDCCLKCR